MIAGEFINQPLITVVTVVRNNCAALEETILSIINQSYPGIEYIIIDGGSTDGSLDIIKKYKDKIHYWLSEPDNGIYDAMNKGIRMAHGIYINFMNSGDMFFNNQVCETVARALIDNNPDVFYGDVVPRSDYNENEVLVKAKPLKNIWKGLVFCHQAAFVKSDVLRKHLFELSLRIVADYDQILNIYKNQHTFYYSPTPVSKVRIGGISYSNNKTYKEEIKVFRKYYPHSIRILYFVFMMLIGLIRNILGEKLTNILREYKWRIVYKERVR